MYSATVSRLIMPPSTPGRKSWRTYRSRFIEPIRINAGVRFWQENRDTLRRAEAEFGVPASVIVGIIGVETIYGRDMGTFRVLDSLSTLAFDYPDTPNRDARTKLFRDQLADYPLWCRETRADVYSVLGRTRARWAFRSSCRPACASTHSTMTRTGTSTCAAAHRCHR